METHWLYRIQGKQHGPVSMTELRELATKGVLQPTDIVAQQGTDKWVAAMAVDGLIRRKQEATAVVPPKEQEATAAVPPKEIAPQGFWNAINAMSIVTGLALLLGVIGLLSEGAQNNVFIGITVAYNLITLVLLRIGATQKDESKTTMASRLVYGNWIFLLPICPLVITVMGTMISAAAAYWGNSVLQQKDVKEFLSDTSRST